MRKNLKNYLIKNFCAITRELHIKKISTSAILPAAAVNSLYKDSVFPYLRHKKKNVVSLVFFAVVVILLSLSFILFPAFWYKWVLLFITWFKEKTLIINPALNEAFTELVFFIFLFLKNIVYFKLLFLIFIYLCYIALLTAWVFYIFLVVFFFKKKKLVFKKKLTVLPPFFFIEKFFFYKEEKFTKNDSLPIYTEPRHYKKVDIFINEHTVKKSDNIFVNSPFDENNFPDGMIYRVTPPDLSGIKDNFSLAGLGLKKSEFSLTEIINLFPKSKYITKSTFRVIDENGRPCSSLTDNPQLSKRWACEDYMNKLHIDYDMAISQGYRVPYDAFDDKSVALMPNPCMASAVNKFYMFEFKKTSDFVFLDNLHVMDDSKSIDIEFDVYYRWIYGCDVENNESVRLMTHIFEYRIVKVSFYPDVAIEQMLTAGCSLFLTLGAVVGFVFLYCSPVIRYFLLHVNYFWLTKIKKND